MNEMNESNGETITAGNNITEMEGSHAENAIAGTNRPEREENNAKLHVVAGSTTAKPNREKRKCNRTTVQRKSLRLEINKQQSEYNDKMIKSRKQRLLTYKVGDCVSIEIDKVDKTSPLHPNVLLGTVTQLDGTYAKVVTAFGVLSTLISFNRLNKCTDVDINFDYSKEITFSVA